MEQARYSTVHKINMNTNSIQPTLKYEHDKLQKPLTTSEFPRFSRQQFFHKPLLSGKITVGAELDCNDISEVRPGFTIEQIELLRFIRPFLGFFTARYIR